jgi:hypothetical protein
VASMMVSVECLVDRKMSLVSDRGRNPLLI